ncbi:MAG: hypothetical protein UU69_C0003G0007 [Candidatus Magasanikbacteria bacterium GW2011_GWA2_41_55]|uniref:Uncharacterized protein n=1 Tax=Candidatus Magasanikbacteria bacterium GW2011_GWA2_41_55 TaxID=1619038 RepID=A0A0G0WL05_9BACT|nr:MAG: hypothetical protein UU69_C0003G0007 [Candidatus Magasanikbacteria bacterium GW2011_GWA2_41_55]
MVVPSQALGVKIGESTRIKSMPRKYSSIARIIASRTRKIAHCLGLRSHKCRYSIKKSGPCSFLPMGYSAAACTICKSITCNSKTSACRGCCVTLPLIIAELSKLNFAQSTQTCSGTLPLLTTAWAKPDPSRICKKKILPDERKLYTQPLISAS